MFKFFGYTCRLHSCDMFDTILIMVSRDMINVLFNLFILHNCLHVLLLILIYHSIMGSDLHYGPRKVAQILGILV